VSLDGRFVYAPRAGKNQWHLGGSAHWRDQRGLADAGAVTRYGQEPKLRTTSLQFLETPELRVAEELKFGAEAAWIRGPLHAAGEVHWLRPKLRGGSEDPTFFGGYAEIGYILTGETRGYGSGRFGRTRVLRPVGKGGFGAVQVAVRYDHLDLSSGTIRGGQQDALLLGLTWIPQDHVRFLLNYGRLSYTGAAIAGPGGSRDYSVQVVGARAQIDF
jgi:phosphate-selective porin OprO/OprP